MELRKSNIQTHCYMLFGNVFGSISLIILAFIGNPSSRSVISVKITETMKMKVQTGMILKYFKKNFMKKLILISMLVTPL